MEYTISPAVEADLPGIAKVFSEAFQETIQHIFGRKDPPPLVEDLFAVCRAAEPEALFVAREGRGTPGSKVLGYIFAPSDARRVQSTFIVRGFAWKWVAAFFTGRSGVRWGDLGKLVGNKLTFVFGSHPREANGRARILSIGVLPDAQGQGIATRLLDAGLGYLDSKTNVVVLEVRPWNGPAMHLYRKHGFRMVGETRDSQGAWFVMVREKGRTAPVTLG